MTKGKHFSKGGKRAYPSQIQLDMVRISREVIAQYREGKNMTTPYTGEPPICQFCHKELSPLVKHDLIWKADGDSTCWRPDGAGVINGHRPVGRNG